MPLPVAEIPPNATFVDAIPFMNGFVVVLLTLTTLWLMAASLKFLPHARPAAPAPARRETAASVAVEPEHQHAIAPEILAAITAAVHVTAGAGHRVVSIRSEQSEWARFGRQRIFSSHKIK